MILTHHVVRSPTDRNDGYYCRMGEPTQYIRADIGTTATKRKSYIDSIKCLFHLTWDLYCLLHTQQANSLDRLGLLQAQSLSRQPYVTSWTMEGP
jgi:hypothetical protein